MNNLSEEKKKVVKQPTIKNENIRLGNKKGYNTWNKTQNLPSSNNDYRRKSTQVNRSQYGFNRSSGGGVGLGKYGVNSGNNYENTNYQDNNNSNSMSTNSSEKNKSGYIEDKTEEIKEKAKKKTLRIVVTLIIKIALLIFSFFLFLILFICVLCAPLFLLGIIDIGDITQSITSGINFSSSGFKSTISSSTAIIPIGSDKITTVGGVEYAIDEPSTTTITATFNGNDSVHNGKHGGIDFGAEVNGVNVIAALSGTVLYPTKDDRIDYPNGYYCSRDGSGYGNYVMIDHGNGLVSLYGHMYANTITVRAGDYVEKGQLIGRTGTSGCSTGGHLHFEMRLNGTPVNPLEYVSVDKPRGDNLNKMTNVESEE